MEVIRQGGQYPDGQLDHLGDPPYVQNVMLLVPDVQPRSYSYSPFNAVPASAGHLRPRPFYIKGLFLPYTLLWGGVGYNEGASFRIEKLPRRIYAGNVPR